MENKKIKILVVDDVKSNLMLLNGVFKNTYEVYTASDGLEALEVLYKESEIAIVILDLIMPNLDGYGVLSKMQNDVKLKDIPILVVSANNDEESQLKALQLGAIDVISKPFNSRLILARVKNTINHRIAEQKAKATEIIQYKLEKQQEELEKSKYDNLTNLYNNYYFYIDINHILNENPNNNYLILRFDIDHFKVFNEVFGFDKGSELLHCIGQHLLKNRDLFVSCSRLEADHFALMTLDNGKLDDIINYILEFFKTYYINFEFSVKFGIYEITEIELEPSSMCDRALLALKQNKTKAGNQIGYYNEKLRNDLLKERELLADMTNAFEREEFVLWFQPQYDYLTNKMFGAEALVRWNHPTKGLLTPYHFIPIMEKNGLITKLDEYVWEKCCQHLQNWIKKYQGNWEDLPPLSVNISRADLISPNLDQVFDKLIKKYQLPYSKLNLEITESAYMDDSEQLLQNVKKLQKLGFVIEMDDFGAGYSSLNTLKDVPVDTLKLDMAFISGAQNSIRGGNVLNSVIRMARWLNLLVIAEGVETKEQADYLKSIGCRYMQGYLFSKPIPTDQFELLYLDKDHNLNEKICKLDLQEAENFWSISNQTALLFNTYLGGSAIFEFCNNNLELLRANDKFYKTLGTSYEEYEPWMTHIQDRFYDEYREILFANIKKAAEENIEVSFETQSKPLNIDGDYLWIYCRIRVLTKSESGIIFYISVDNISEKKQAEQEANKHKILMNALIEKLPSGIMVFEIVNNQIHLFTYNDSNWQLQGFNSEEEYKKSICFKYQYSNIYYEDKEEFDYYLYKIIKGENNENYSFSHRIVLVNGETKWCHTTLQKIIMDDGKEYIQDVFYDLTLYKESEIQRYGKPLLAIFDEVFEINFFNNTYTPILAKGTTILNNKDNNLGDLYNDRIFNYVYFEDRADLIERFQYINKAQPEKADELPKLEYRVIDENDKCIWHSLQLVFVDKGKYLCGIIDITKQKNTEEIIKENAKLQFIANQKQLEADENRFVIKMLKFSFIYYNVDNDSLHCSIYYKDETLNFSIENYLKADSPTEYFEFEEREKLRNQIMLACQEETTKEIILQSYYDGKKQDVTIKLGSYLKDDKVYCVLGVIRVTK